MDISPFVKQSRLLDAVFAPVTFDSFLDEYYEKKPLLVQRQRPTFYRELLSDRDLDFAVHSACKRRGAVELLSGGSSKPRYVNDPEVVTRFVRRGFSLRINSLQRFLPTLSRLRVALEQRMSCNVNMNMYLTPGDGRALGKHYDTHDVLVVQISGQKHWILSDGGVQDPLEFMPLLRGESKPYQKRYRAGRQQDKKDSNITQDFILEAGDLLYLPRGFQHEAQGELGTVSCHITIGLQGATYLDLLTAALADAAQTVPALRKSLPAGYLIQPEAGMRVEETAQAILSKLPGAIQMGSSLAYVKALFANTRDNLLEASLLRPAHTFRVDLIGLTTRMRLRSGIILGYERLAIEIRLFWRDGSLELPELLRPAVEYMIDRERFRASDLPGDLTDEQKVAFCRDLVEAGLLYPQRRADSAGEEEPELKAGDLKGWLPIRYDARTARVTWENLGSRPLEEPFFRQTLRRLRGSSDVEPTRETTLSALRQHADAQPAGFIFHVSRCGSTLVSNAMRVIAGVAVVSEADPINEAATATGLQAFPGGELAGEQGRSALRRLVETFCAYSGPEQRTIFKLTSWNVLYIEAFRALWPAVPVLIVIRDPAEVMVSCIAQPPGWMYWRERPDQRGAAPLIEELASASPEEFCSRYLNEFMRKALESCDERCKVVDYSQLNIGGLIGIAAHFGLSPTHEDIMRIESSLSSYSKDPDGKRDFKADSESKQSAVTEAIRSALNLSSESYTKLRQQADGSWRKFR